MVYFQLKQNANLIINFDKEDKERVFPDSGSLMKSCHREKNFFLTKKYLFARKYLDSKRISYYVHLNYDSVLFDYYLLWNTWKQVYHA